MVNVLLILYWLSFNNGVVDFWMEMCYCSVLRRFELRRDGKRGKSEDVKEEFFFKLGFEWIEVWDLEL